MIILNEWFKEIGSYLPKGELCKSFSVYPLPYKGYSELWVETESGKRFRGLCNNQALLSDLTEFNLPQNLTTMQGVQK